MQIPRIRILIPFCLVLAASLIPSAGAGGHKTLSPECQKELGKEYGDCKPKKKCDTGLYCRPLKAGDDESVYAKWVNKNKPDASALGCGGQNICMNFVQVRMAEERAEAKP